MLRRQYKYIYILPSLVLSLSSVAKANTALCRSTHAQHVQKTLSRTELTAASWEISRHGISEMVSETYGQENAFYYTLVGLLAKENILLDGPGGGAKTLAIRKAFEAQLRSVRGPQDRQEIEAFKMELLKLIWSDHNQVNSSKRIFTQQLHATISGTKFLGGPDPFKFVEGGKHEIDYSKALISDKNMYAILDEIEKAPVALQMTLLSILNERQALAGNKIIQTALESVAATTNATLSQMIAQAAPHEVGGRKAMVDRFALKVHVVNVAENSNSLFLMLEKIEAGKNQKRFTVIDLRNLHHLIDQVQIPAEVLDAMSDITLDMDRYYAGEMKKAYAALNGPKDIPKYYPPFSGSTRTQGKVPRLWKAAFIVRQLMQGIAYQSLDLTMNPKDLIDVAPAVLHGGPDVFVADGGVRIYFFQSLSKSVFFGSNDKTSARKEYGISQGIYNPHTGIFSYISARTEERRHVRFDAKTGKLVALDPDVKLEILYNLDSQLPMDALDNPFWDRFGDLQKTLLMAHNKQLPTAKHVPPLQYKTTGRMQEFVNGSESPIRNEARNQLKEIDEAHRKLLESTNNKILFLADKPLTKIDTQKYQVTETRFQEAAQAARAKLSQAIRSNNMQAIEDASAQSVRLAIQELKYRFLEAGSNVKGLVATILNRKNAMLMGPPGSGKTLLSRTMIEAEVEFLSEAQIAQANSVLSEALLQNPHGEHSIWIKQFHPMSNEGDVVGRIDLKAVREGHGYAYNRTGSLAAKEVLFGLLDEFEKAPPGVKTALLSLLNERQLLDGHEVLYSNLIAVVINTNATPGQFLTGMGDFSTGFPIFDRIQKKIYSLNKLTDEGVKEFHRRVHLNIPMRMKSPLFIHPLQAVAKTYKLESHELRLLAKIHQFFMVDAVKKSEIERQMFESESDNYRDFYMNSRGESNRSAISAMLEEFRGVATLNKILAGKNPSQLRADGNRFDLVDLEAFGELYLTDNRFYSLTHEYDDTGMINFKVLEHDFASIEDRLDPAELKTRDDLKAEFELIAQKINEFTHKFIEDQKALITAIPNLYPSLFASKADRQAWATLDGN